MAPGEWSRASVSDGLPGRFAIEVEERPKRISNCSRTTCLTHLAGPLPSQG